MGDQGCDEEQSWLVSQARLSSEAYHDNDTCVKCQCNLASAGGPTAADTGKQSPEQSSYLFYKLTHLLTLLLVILHHSFEDHHCLYLISFASSYRLTAAPTLSPPTARPFLLQSRISFP